MKYTSENVVAIKRDVEQYQRQLIDLTNAISQRKLELIELEKQKENAVTEQVRNNSKSIIASIEESVLGFFNKKKKEIKTINDQEKNLKEVIKKLQFHRAVLASEIQQAPLPDNRLPEIDRLIKAMRKDLGRAVSQADAIEGEVEKLKTVKDQFEKIVSSLKEDEEKTKQSIAQKQAELDRIDSKREAVLAELVKEKALEAQLRERNHDVATMQYRLTEEYKEVYKRTPSRTNKV
jgi:chromosome segregation ATPase